MVKAAKAFGVIVLVLAGLAVASAAGLTERKETHSWRYKITVSVDTPEGVKTGSAVRQMRMEFLVRDKLDSSSTVIRRYLTGEAVVVDLGKRGKVYALLKGISGSEDHGKLISTQAFSKPNGFEKYVDYFKTIHGKKQTLELYQYPLLVTFKDPTDPKTVVNLYEVGCRKETYCSPDEMSLIADRFEELFGKDVKLKDISIEITDEPITSGIEKWLPSFRNENGYQDWVNNLEYGDFRIIGPENFKAME